MCGRDHRTVTSRCPPSRLELGGVVSTKFLRADDFSGIDGRRENMVNNGVIGKEILASFVPTICAFNVKGSSNSAFLGVQSTAKTVFR